ncbi:hypothetical protein LAZ67_8003485 [Cordylochernes scorpioides]|uniref:Uncharacterized protein n=1 Tax=Cordylochernes scorpioides TaxID=51811 RepID=A0ABY6KUT0_9ARAC|nr:hypothetical protein LAZ67_8003485 [Cordylochernes scorpioides]
MTRRKSGNQRLFSWEDRTGACPSCSVPVMCSIRFPLLQALGLDGAEESYCPNIHGKRYNLSCVSLSVVVNGGYSSMVGLSSKKSGVVPDTPCSPCWPSCLRSVRRPPTVLRSPLQRASTWTSRPLSSTRSGTASLSSVRIPKLMDW